MEHILKITEYILNSFIHIWPYLLITIPLAVAVQLTGASRFIKKSLSKNPLLAILLAAAIGAFSPFCSCSVIPVITSLLISGVPLAPVMAFWIASPSMDPEIFFLSTTTIGMKLSVWRLAATFVISIGSGYLTHLASVKGYLQGKVLRENLGKPETRPWKFVGEKLIAFFNEAMKMQKDYIMMMAQRKEDELKGLSSPAICCVDATSFKVVRKEAINQEGSTCEKCEAPKKRIVSFRQRLFDETWNAVEMVVKFMALAFFINALIHFYVPQDLVSNLLGGNGSASVFLAGLIGIPAYANNITALPFVGGLLNLGMNQGAALAFLIAGPTTTLPAMVAVWGIAKKKIFMLYISFSLLGAILFGLLFNLVN